MSVVARFEICYLQFLDPQGNVVAPLPEFARAPQNLVALYRWMVLMRAYDAKAIALQRTYDATPDPKLVVAVGDCGCNGGVFGESYASLGRVANVIPVDVEVPGCPPTPVALLQGILQAIGRGARDATPLADTPRAGPD